MPLAKLESALRESIAAGVRDEMESARDRSKGKLDWKIEVLGIRPGGELAEDIERVVVRPVIDENHFALAAESVDDRLQPAPERAEVGRLVVNGNDNRNEFR